MKVLRRAHLGDGEKLLALAKTASVGLTTLPADLPTIERRIAASGVAFGSEFDADATHDFFMVLEDTATGDLIGTTAIISNVGRVQPFYCYRILRLAQVSSEPAIRVDTEMLQMSNDFTGAAEVASLFLHKDHRKSQTGKLLAKARYMLMAAAPERFAKKVIAEIRGWVDEDDQSPFWEAIGRHFFGMSFADADRISGMGNSQFIADLMPKFPIYTALLPDAARAVIGKPHDSARAAVRLLEADGFQFSGAVDIFDAGPAFEVPLTSIKTVRNSVLAEVGGIVDGNSDAEPTHIVSREDLSDFRAVLTRAVCTDSGLFLPQDAAEALSVGRGDAIRYCALNHDK